MKIEINTTPAYPVYIENGILDRAGVLVAEKAAAGAKILIVSDTNVFPIYGGRVEAALKKEGLHPYRFLFDAGEQSKKIQTVYQMYLYLAENDFTRSDVIVTLGGGVAGDMGGFSAATYLRGISFVQISTSLLSQVDASVGGKTGVDLPFGKNLVGAFHQPAAVITDPETLKTLPRKQMNDGLGEVIKYGCISDPVLFDQLAKEGTLSMPEVIAQCIACKKELVETDTRDNGRRMILNFGHTFGHALEKLKDFKGLLHGEAVGIGMVIAADIGEKLGVTPKGVKEQIVQVLEKYGLPTTHEYTADQLIAATALDKKSQGNVLNLILLQNIGEAVIYKTTREEIRKVME